MAEKKKQHYLPKSYFKLFSNDGHTINLFNLKRMKFFNGSFTNFCQEDYFYSKNKSLEDSFTLLEDKCIRSVKKVIEDGFEKLPKEDYFHFLLFVMFQHSRTKASKLNTKEMTQAFVENVMKPYILSQPEAKESGLTEETFQKLKITKPSDHLDFINNSLLGVSLIGDLISLRVINKTDLNFVFGDAPCIFYNNFFKDKRNHGRLGWQSAGLMILFPLNNKTLVVLFDPEFYAVNTKDYTVEVTRNEDIEALNSLQFVMCLESIYFSDSKQSKNLENLYSKISSHSRSKRTMKVYEPFIREDGKIGQIIHATNDHTDFSLDVSFLKNKDIVSDKLVRNVDAVESHRKWIDEYMKQFKEPDDPLFTSE